MYAAGGHRLDDFDDIILLYNLPLCGRLKFLRRLHVWTVRHLYQVRSDAFHTSFKNV